MCSQCIYMFLAGALAFHTLGHIMLAFTNMLPMQVFGMTFTGNLNTITIIVSALLTGLCLYRAGRCACGCKIKK